MSTGWDRDAVVAAVSSHLDLRIPDPSPTWTFGEVRRKGDEMVVIVRLPGKPGLFGVSYSLASLPYGPNTGEVCDTPEEWAVEIALDLDEFVCGAEPIAATDGPTPLRWWQGDSITRP